MVSIIPKTATADKATAEIAMFCLFDLFSSSLTLLIRLLRSTLELELLGCNPKLDSPPFNFSSLIMIFKHGFEKLKITSEPEMV